MAVAKALGAALALAIAANASPIAQPQDLELPVTETPIGATSLSAVAKCDLDYESPKSWADSGAEKLLSDYLEKNSPAKWLQAISKQAEGGNTVAIDCAHISSNTCNVLQGPADCEQDKYAYYFLRVMSAQINSAFKSLHETLQNEVIDKALATDEIIDDFKLPEPPKEDLPGLLNNIAVAPAVLSTIFGFAPGGTAASGIMSLIGAGFTAAAQNLEEEEIEVPDYAALKPKVSARLRSFFTETEKMLQDTLLAIFGDDTLSAEDSEKLLRSMIEKMGPIGVPNLDKDAKHPVSELLKGGEWILPAQKSPIDEAMQKAFATIQQGLIGNLLAASQVYVEQEMPAFQEGAVECSALGTLKDGNSCLVIKRRNFGAGGKGEDPFRLEDNYLKLMTEKYNIDLHTLIRNVRDCKNGEADNNQVLTDGSLPKCFFGMAFAQRVHSKDREFTLTTFSSCVSWYQNREGVPEWITDYRGQCQNTIPKWQPCKVKLEEVSYWTEAGLDRYRVDFIGENVGIMPICPYVHDGRRCAGGSNRQCWEDNGKARMDINFAKGGIGHGDYRACIDDIRKNYRDDNRCTD